MSPRSGNLDPGLRIVPEGDAAIENEPVAGITVEVQIHPDLAGAAKRDKIERAVVAVGQGPVHRFLLWR